jgi:hypothetical protein
MSIGSKISAPHKALSATYGFEKLSAQTFLKSTISQQSDIYLVRSVGNLFEKQLDSP